MAKNTTKKIKELRGEKPEKIKNEQLDKIQRLVGELNQMQFEIGRLESQKHAMLHDISMVNESLNIVKKELETDYGTADVNIKDGTINYSKENVKTD